MTTKEQKAYVEGLKDALDLIDYNYFGKRIGDQKATKPNMRRVMIKADEKGTAQYAFWNFIKTLKEEIGKLGGLSQEEIIKVVKKTQETITV